MLLVSFSSRTQKMTLEHFFNHPDRTNFENWENAEIAGNSVKNDLLWPSKHQNYVIFQDIYMKFCAHIHLTGFFHIYFGFLKIRKIYPIFWKYFSLITFQNFQNLWWQFDRKGHFQPSVEKQSFLSFKCYRDSVSRKPSFLPKNGKTWLHSDVIYGRHIESSKFSFGQNVSNW